MKSLIAKSLITILFLTAFVFAAKAQENCAWTNTAAKVTQNLRLGMNAEEVRTALGGKPKIKAKQTGEYRFFQNYIDNKPPANLRGVRAFYLRFFDGRIYQIEIFYENDFAPTRENFTALIAKDFNFPASEWIYKNLGAETVCGENKLVADYILNPRIELTNVPILEKTNEINKLKK